MQAAGQSVVTSSLERILAMLAAVVCLILTAIFWFSLSAHQQMWPLPGLYFLEMVALSIISAFLFIRGDPHASLFTWGAAGAMSAFASLGAFSIGFFYLPVAVTLAVVSIIWDVRNKQRIPVHLGIFLLAGLIQAALMLAAVFWR